MCSGTMPALVAKPTTSRTNPTEAWPDEGSTVLIAANDVPPPAAASRANPISSNRKLSWVMTAYQRVADRTSALRAWSVRTRTVDATAITSHMSRNEMASDVAGTSCIPTRKSGNAVHAVRDAAGPCA